MKTLSKLVKPLFTVIFVIAFLVACSTGNGSSNEGKQPAPNNTSTTKEPTNEGNSDAEAKPVTMEFWHAFGEGEEVVLLEEVIPLFKEQYPHITVNATRMPTENLEQQIITAVAGSVAPDIMRMDNTWIAKFAREGALQPVDGLENFEAIKEASFDAPMSTNFYNGNYYGVPLGTNTKIAIYNKELLEKAGATAPPETMDELVALARTLKEQGIFGMTIGGVDAWNMPPWFWSLGGRITDEKFTVASGYLNSDASVQALQTIVDWNKEGLLAPPILAGQPGTWEGLRGEEGVPATYLMINDGPWFFSILGDDVKDKMIPAKMPNGPDGQSHSVIGGEDLVIFKGAKQPEAAWQFAQFLSTEEIQLLLAKRTGAIPTNKVAANSSELDEVYYIKYYVEELETALARTPSAQWDKISNSFQLAFESVLREQATPKEALDRAAKEIDELLKIN